MPRLFSLTRFRRFPVKVLCFVSVLFPTVWIIFYQDHSFIYNGLHFRNHNTDQPSSSSGNKTSRLSHPSANVHLVTAPGAAGSDGITNNGSDFGAGKLVCVQPKLDLKDPVMMASFSKMAPIDCKGRRDDLVYVDNGTLRYSVPIAADTTCDMFPIIRGPGDYKIAFGPPVKNVKDKTPLVSDFFKVECTAKGQKVYDNIHLGVHANKTLNNRLRKAEVSPYGLGLSVAMLGFDSMSRMSWLRRMPKTRDYFVNTLGAIELKGYNIMGDGTPAALFPMLTGKHEQELPEARRNFKGATTVDNFPWIWKDFQKNGYVTSWADAEINIAPFNYRLLGFEHSPTDFFMRPFYLAATPRYNLYKQGCHGSLRKHQVWFNFFRDIFHMYPSDPKFLFHFYATMSHGNNNLLTMADDDLLHLVSSLQDGGFLNNTLLVLFADHGARFSDVRATLSGKLEERMPYFSLLFPRWFHRKHPDLIDNLRTNSRRLTSPMDIHETLRDVLHFSGGALGNVTNRGISLFKEIPKERHCGHADIAPHWCSCLAWTKAKSNDSNVKRAVQEAVDTMNSLTHDYRDDCVEITLKNVTSARMLKTSDSVLRFKQTTGDRGLKPVMSDKTNIDTVLYQLTLFTTPGDGEFELTVEHALAKDVMKVNPKAISRLNKYGNAPACILNRTREIRQYCYCKDNLKKSYGHGTGSGV